MKFLSRSILKLNLVVCMDYGGYGESAGGGLPRNITHPNGQ